MPTKEKLNTKEKAISLIVVAIEIAIISYMVNYVIYHHTGWDGMGLVFFIPFLLIFSVWGIIRGISFLRKKQISYVSIILLVVSLCSLPPFPFNIAFKAISTPLIQRYDQSKVSLEQKQKNQEIRTEANKRYLDFVQRFKTPQKISFVDDQYAVLILENGDIISPFKTFNSVETRTQILTWAKNNLVNQEVRIELPPEKNVGMITYCSDSTASNPGNRTFEIIRSKYGVPIEKGGICDIKRATVYYNGQKIDENFNNF